MKKLSALVAAAAAAAILPLGSADATPVPLNCTNGLIIFSRIGAFLPAPVPTGAVTGEDTTSVGNTTYDTKAAGCDEDLNGAGVGADTRYIYPGSTMVKGRSVNDQGPAAGALSPHSWRIDFNGVTQGGGRLKYSGGALSLVLGGYYAESNWVAISPTATVGGLEVRFATSNAGDETYRSIDQL